MNLWKYYSFLYELREKRKRAFRLRVLGFALSFWDPGFKLDREHKWN